MTTLTGTTATVSLLLNLVLLVLVVLLLLLLKLVLLLVVLLLLIRSCAATVTIKVLQQWLAQYRYSCCATHLCGSSCHSIYAAEVAAVAALSMQFQ
eukprot:7813-Heterococcus_DN1.PRE.1